MFRPGKVLKIKKLFGKVLEIYYINVHFTLSFK